MLNIKGSQTQQNTERVELFDCMKCNVSATLNFIKFIHDTCFCFLNTYKYTKFWVLEVDKLKLVTANLKHRFRFS